MNKQIKDFNVLKCKVAEHLETQLYFSPPAIEQYHKIWRRVSFYMDLKGHKYYSPEVEKELFQYHFNNRPKRELTSSQIRLYNGIKMLSDFMASGNVKLLVRPKLKQIVFNGPIGDIINCFIDYKKTGSSSELF